MHVFPCNFLCTNSSTVAGEKSWLIHVTTYKYFEVPVLITYFNYAYLEKEWRCFTMIS